MSDLPTSENKTIRPRWENTTIVALVTMLFSFATIIVLLEQIRTSNEIFYRQVKVDNYQLAKKTCFNLFEEYKKIGSSFVKYDPLSFHDYKTLELIRSSFRKFRSESGRRARKIALESPEYSQTIFLTWKKSLTDGDLFRGVSYPDRNSPRSNLLKHLSKIEMESFIDSVTFTDSFEELLLNVTSPMIHPTSVSKVDPDEFDTIKNLSKNVVKRVELLAINFQHEFVWSGLEFGENLCGIDFERVFE